MQMRNTSQNDECFKKHGMHYYEDMKKCRHINSSNYVKTPKGKEVHSKAMKKWRSKFKRLKFNDGKVHYVPLEKAKEIEHLPVYQRILKNIKE